jgi:sugar phosphate isomerase/epimerase
MKLDSDSSVHLTYCSNIHPGETWGEVRAQVGAHLPKVKAQLSPDGPFGIGLRLSADAAESLSEPAALEEFKSFLASEDLYVFTINGFPYGEFHGRPVKENVYLPDWRDEARLAYSNRLADLLAELLPDDPALDGSISTVPGAFKPEIKTDADVAAMAENLIRHAAYLWALRERTGRTVSLELEPEPCCFIETIDEAVDFFRNHLFSANAIAGMADRTGLSGAAAEAALRRHLGVCLDLCHAAVEFEDADEALAKLRDAGIRIGKMQISAGLRFARVDHETVDLLRPFNDAVYLHQVVERSGAGLARYVDLPEAFAAADGKQGDREWRVHFHVPIFLDDLGRFSTTQDFIRDMLARQRAAPFTRHLEVETYTWDVLPPEYRNVDVDAAIVRELQWVRAQLGQ